jgi:hypothetical protein
MSRYSAASRWRRAGPPDAVAAIQMFRNATFMNLQDSNVAFLTFLRRGSGAGARYAFQEGQEDAGRGFPAVVLGAGPRRR